jgi:hypothetical protein
MPGGGIADMASNENPCRFHSSYTGVAQPLNLDFEAFLATTLLSSSHPPSCQRRILSSNSRRHPRSHLRLHVRAPAPRRFQYTRYHSTRARSYAQTCSTSTSSRNRRTSGPVALNKPSQTRLEYAWPIRRKCYRTAYPTSTLRT